MDCHLRSGQLLVISVQYAKIFFQNMLRLEEVYGSNMFSPPSSGVEKA